MNLTPFSQENKNEKKFHSLSKATLQESHSDIFFLRTKFTPSSYLFKPSNEKISTPKIILNSFPINSKNMDTSIFEQKSKLVMNSSKTNETNIKNLENSQKGYGLKKTPNIATTSKEKIKEFFNEKAAKTKKIKELNAFPKNSK